MSRDDVVLYEGAGASPYFVKQMLRQELDFSRHRLVSAQASDLRHGGVLQTARLFILPGGEDKPYCTDLEGAGNANIRRFGERGGTIDMYCAGAYCGARRIEFTGHDKRIKAARQLALFDGTAVGSIAAFGPPYDYTLHTAAAVEIGLRDGTRLHSHYHGGPLFVPEPGSRVRPLAWYEGLPNRPIAALETPVGRGVARLFGIHPEKSAGKIGPSLASWKGGIAYGEKHLPNLQQSEAKRRRWMRSLLADAGLSLVPLPVLSPRLLNEIGPARHFASRLQPAT